MTIDIKPLGELCDFFNGKPHEKNIDENGHYKVVNSKFVSSEGRIFKRTEQQMFSLVKGDICLVMSDVPNGKTLAKCFIVDQDNTYSLNQRICAIRTTKFNLKFLYYQLNRHPYLLKFNNGENQTNLRKADVLSCPLWCPALEIQKSIVEKLEEAFADIEKTKLNAEQNRNNAKELFDSFFENLLDNKEWTKKSLQDVVADNCSLSYGIVQPGDEYPEGLPIVRPTDLKNKLVDMNKLKRIDPKKAASYKRTSLTGNELLLCVRGDTGVISISHEDLKGANVTRGIVPISFDAEVLDLQFGYLLFTSAFVQRQIKEKTYGAALMQINIRDLKLIKIVIPPLKEQKKLEVKINTLKKKVDKLEEIYSTKVSALVELKQSLLQKAFNGELA